jgi:hypothetical protein
MATTATLPPEGSAAITPNRDRIHSGLEPPPSSDRDDFIFASIEEDQSTAQTRLGVREDKTNIVKRAFQMGAAVMHVVYLDTYWRVSDCWAT